MRTLARLAVAVTAFGVAATVSTAQAAPDHKAPGKPTERVVPVTPAAADRAVPGSYIVTLHPDADVDKTVLAHGKLRTTAVYDSVLHGFAAQLTDQQLDRVRRDPAVLAVEADQTVSSTATQTPPSGSWGLDRLDQRSRPLSRTYTYTRTGSGVTAYVIDSGISASHPEFGGRAASAYDVFGGNGNDCFGHGTHVAGIIGAKTYGVAKAVKLRGVRVLDCRGGGTVSQAIKGIDWVANRAVKPAVANISLVAGASGALDAAAYNLTTKGIPVAVAAGNNAGSACYKSPARAQNVITVAATDSADRNAAFSNYGFCVELYAPGVSILSTNLNGTTSTKSGTSMAAPHVAGVLALRMQGGTTSGASARSWLLSTATTGLVTGGQSYTPNRLLFKSTL